MNTTPTFAPIPFLPSLGYESLVVDGQRIIRIDGRAASIVTEPVNGPLMFEHPLIRNGRPTSILDFEYTQATGVELNEDQRVLPADRDFSNLLNVSTRLSMVEIVSRRTCHAEWTKQNKWRGRPAAFTQYNLEALVLWRDNVFLGKLTIRDLARNVGVSEPAAARFAHGETLWYI